jgi:hypothetical protein
LIMAHVTLPPVPENSYIGPFDGLTLSFAHVLPFIIPKRNFSGQVSSAMVHG